MPTLKEALSATPWRDKEGIFRPNVNTTPSNQPSLKTFRGNLNAWAMTATDLVDVMFHIPHDWIIQSDLYVHLHWGHNDTAIGADPNDRNLVDFYASYADRNGTPPYDVFQAEVSGQFDDPDMTIENYPQYCHVVTEILLANSGKTGAALFDSDLIETDGLLLATLKQNTIPGLTGGEGEPFIFTCDLHYQSDGSGTLSKDPDYDT